MSPNSKKSLISLGLLASSTLLFGCGGGSSGSGNTVVPPPPPPTNTAPVVTGDASPTIAENLTAVSTYTATDAEGDAITLSLSGADAALFTIDTDGNLSFVTAPDFDNGETGPFEVVIVATDDGTGNLSGEFTAQVSVSNPNTAPVVTGEANVTVAKNRIEVAIYTATDAENDTITFSLSGADAALFTIDVNGNLSFVTAPDFDNGETGPFAVIIVATDDGAGSLSGELAAQVSVSDGADLAVRAVVQTVASDFVSGSEVVFMDRQTQQVTNSFYIKEKTDYTINTYQSDVYHIGSFEIDTIEKYDAETPDSQVWSFTTQGSGDSTSRNPYSLISVNATKAYLIRYGSDKVWIVNPQVTATQQADFKIGELDLSEYILPGNLNGTPRPAAATIADGKLYIAMQRLSDAWVVDTAYVAVFDTITDEEIETNANAEDNLKGIPLTGMNPLRDSIISANNKIYVTTNGPSFPTDISASWIEEITPSDYSIRTVLPATIIPNNTNITIKGSVVVSAEKGYFYTGTFDADFNEVSSLYEFNPTTGAIVAANVGESGTEAISYATLDKSNILWVSVANSLSPGVDLINTDTNTKTSSRLITELNPSAIRFVE